MNSQIQNLWIKKIDCINLNVFHFSCSSFLSEILSFYLAAFSSGHRTFYSISCGVGLVVTSSLCFRYSENIFILPSLLRNFFWICSFFLQLFNDNWYAVMFIFSDVKCMVIQIIILFMKYSIFLCFQIFLYLLFINLTMMFLDTVIIVFILPKVCWASWICNFMSLRMLAFLKYLVILGFVDICVFEIHFLKNCCGEGYVCCTLSLKGIIISVVTSWIPVIL